MTLGVALLDGAILDDLVEKIGQETTHKSHRVKHQHGHRYRHRVDSDEKRWQRALKFLGYYHGKIDGDLYTKASYDAVKRFQEKRQELSTGFLEEPSKIYLSHIDHILTLDSYLNMSTKHKRGKNKKIQAALAIEGFYSGHVDGKLGKKTKHSIRRYKMAADLNGTNTTVLTAEEKEALIEKAKLSARMQLNAFREEDRFYSAENNSSRKAD